MVWIVDVFLNTSNYGIWVDKSTDIIHMTVCIITNDTIFQPNDIRNTQIFVENRLVIRFRKVFISDLSLRI